jgi:7,8-dihydropterin-6-yl-methyl-4-(beta-D-ribofuranosyl)aminobenzene 5'-phosphate synthase
MWFWKTFILTVALALPSNLQGQSKVNEITILFDNYVDNPMTKSGWGWACLINYNNNKILFDAGGDETIFAYNLKNLEVDISNLNSVIFSHEHGDHTAGLNYVLNSNDNLKVYVPISFSGKFEELVKSKNGKLIRVSTPMEICGGVFSTGEMGIQIKEQSLILDTEKGLVIITGCSHQGIINVLQKAKEILNKNIYMVLGGFHLLQHSNNSVIDIIKEFKILGVEICGATHCTGEEQIQLFRESFGKNFKELGTGKIIRF